MWFLPSAWHWNIILVFLWRAFALVWGTTLFVTFIQPTSPRIPKNRRHGKRNAVVGLLAIMNDMSNSANVRAEARTKYDAEVAEANTRIRGYGDESLARHAAEVKRYDDDSARIAEETRRRHREEDVANDRRWREEQDRQEDERRRREEEDRRRNSSGGAW